MHTLTAGGHQLSLGNGDIPFSHFGWSDGSVAKGRMGAGVVVQSETTRVEVSQSIVKATQPDSTAAELCAISILLEKAMEQGAKAIQVGLDSFEAIAHFQKFLCGKPTRYQAEVQKLQELAAQFERLELINIANRKNKEADNLSRKAIGLLAR